jgi:anaphase-promoting complex subunit 10
MQVTIEKTLDMTEYRELGSDATFTISSAKPGNGVEQLRDNNPDTYWQSDGAFPHFINIQFLRRVTVSKLCLYLDYVTDESYTPKKLSVSCGSSLHDLFDVTAIELNEPVGWVCISLSDADLNPMGETDASNANGLRAHFLQVKILSMHQNGRDNHVRQIRILGPRESPRIMGDIPYEKFKTVEMQQFATIR